MVPRRFATRTETRKAKERIQNTRCTEASFKARQNFREKPKNECSPVRARIGFPESRLLRYSLGIRVWLSESAATHFLTALLLRYRARGLAFNDEQYVTYGEPHAGQCSDSLTQCCSPRNRGSRFQRTRDSFASTGDLEEVIATRFLLPPG